jgi:ABC-type Zn2+ transport system substrate-binding protein/surface adhesin
MGDDIQIIVPPVEEISETEEFNHEEVGEELLALLDKCLQEIEALHARLAECEARLTELGAREYAEVEHRHPEFAAAEHRHDNIYAGTEHQHEQKQPEPQQERDKPPESHHWYFKRLND